MQLIYVDMGVNSILVSACHGLWVASKRHGWGVVFILSGAHAVRLRLCHLWPGIVEYFMHSPLVRACSLQSSETSSNMRRLAGTLGVSHPRQPTLVLSTKQF